MFFRKPGCAFPGTYVVSSDEYRLQAEQFVESKTPVRIMVYFENISGPVRAIDEQIICKDLLKNVQPAGLIDDTVVFEDDNASLAGPVLNNIASMQIFLCKISFYVQSPFESVSAVSYVLILKE